MTAGTRATLAALTFAVLSAGLAPRPAMAGQAPAGEPFDSAQGKLAAQAVKASGFEQGMCLVVGETDGALTAALAKASRMYVQGCTWDAGVVQKARQALVTAGVAERASIVWIEGEGLPYVDSLVNVVVAGPGAGRGLTAAEILRALAPGGLALVGAEFEAGAKAAGAKDVKAAERQGWIQFGKAVDPAFDGWTHNLGGADLTSVNNDRAAGPWAEIRWLGDPRWGSLYMTYSGRVTAGGRFYYAENRTGSSWWVARDAWNGFELWRVPLVGSAAVPPKGPGGTLACDDRQVYAVDSKVLIARDGRTGAKVKDYAPGFVPAAVSSAGAFLLVSNIQTNVRTAGQAAALDKESGKVLWTRPTGAHPPAEGGVAFVATASELEAVDIATGASLWKAAVPKAVGSLWAFCKDGVVYVQHKPEQIAAFDARKGALLWKREKPACHYGAFPYPGELWLVDLAKKGQNNVLVLDPRTGEKKRELPASLGACFPLTGCANYLLYLHSYYLDLKSGAEVKQGTLRSPCCLGHVPANGLTYFLPHHCDCSTSLRGFAAMAPAGSRKWFSDAGKDGSSPLFAAGPAPAAGAEKPDDWPMYRRDPRRSNAATTRLPDQLRPLWSEKLGGSRLTQAVAAYGVVCTAEPRTHRVFARDADTGQERWSFAADGRVEYSPILHKGLCLFSTGAGSVYALDAATGREVWRLRAAPAEKYIADGHLDRVLLRPVNPLAQVVFESFNISGVNEIILGVGIMAYAGAGLDLVWTATDLLAALVFAPAAALVYVGVFLGLTCVSFWSEDRLGLAPPVYNVIRFSRYPLTIYSRWVQIFLMFVLPFAWVAFYPATWFVGAPEFRRLALLTPLVGLTVFGVAYSIWSRGLRRYGSTGS